MGNPDNKDRRISNRELLCLLGTGVIMGSPWIFHPLLMPRANNEIHLTDFLFLIFQGSQMLATVSGIGRSSGAFYYPLTPGVHTLYYDPRFGHHVPYGAQTGDEWFVQSTVVNGACCAVALLVGYVFHTPGIHGWLIFIAINSLLAVIAGLRAWLGKRS